MSLCEGLLGRDLYEGLRRAGDGARALLTMIKWPVPINVRIAYGLAAGCQGGRNSDHLAEWSLSPADFWNSTQEEFDDFVPRSDNNREKRPRSPATMAQWARRADNMIRAFSLVYGAEHAEERLAARKRLENMHEENHHEWPREEVWSVWDELTWRWWEEIKHSYRTFLREMGTETVTKADLRFYALAPNEHGVAKFRFPTTWDFDTPDGYFQLVVLPRRQRRLTRSMWSLVNKPTRTPKAGDNDDNDERRDHDPDGQRRGGNPEAPKKPAPNLDPKKPYPAGKRLLPWEATRSLRLAPKDNAGKRLCWDFSTHITCKQAAGACPHSHRQITSTGGLPWEVVAQLLRRGGLKTGTPVPPGEVYARIDQLRKHSKAEKGQPEGSRQPQQGTRARERPRCTRRVPLV